MLRETADKTQEQRATAQTIQACIARSMLKFMKSLEKAGGHMPHGQSVRVQPLTLCCVSFPSLMLFLKKR